MFITIPLTAFDLVFLAIYIVALIAVVSAIVFWRRDLDRAIPKMLKAFPQVVAQFCIFSKGVVLRLSNLLIGGAIGLAWVCYNQLTGQPLPMNVFWSLVVVMFVCACFGAWREQYLIVEAQKARRPDFRHAPSPNEITPRIIPFALPNIGATAHLAFHLCFQNRGSGPAFNPRLTVYFGWLDNISVIFRAGGVQAIRDFAVGEWLCQDFWVREAAVRHGNDSNNQPRWQFPNRELAILVEIESRANSAVGQIIAQTHYFHWRPMTPKALLAPSSTLIETMTPHVEALKNSLSTPPQQVLDAEEPEQPHA